MWSEVTSNFGDGLQVICWQSVPLPAQRVLQGLKALLAFDTESDLKYGLHAVVCRVRSGEYGDHSANQVRDIDLAPRLRALRSMCRVLLKYPLRTAEALLGQGKYYDPRDVPSAHIFNKYKSF